MDPSGLRTIYEAATMNCYMGTAASSTELSLPSYGARRNPHVNVIRGLCSIRKPKEGVVSSLIANILGIVVLVHNRHPSHRNYSPKISDANCHITVYSSTCSNNSQPLLLHWNH